MIEEIKEDNNCIVKAFENNPISILKEDNGDKKVYYFKASDIGKALNLSNIRASIQNYDGGEQVVRKAYDLRGCEQDTTFLSSKGVYRLLYNSKKPAAKKFRDWAGDILDDIVFNESKELRKQLEQHKLQLEQKDSEHAINLKLSRHKLLIEQLKNKKAIYLCEVGENLIKIGSSKDIDDRKQDLKFVFGECTFLDVFDATDDFREIEQNILIKVNEYKYKELINDHISNEVVKLTDRFNYNQLKTIVQDEIKYYKLQKNNFTPQQQYIIKNKELDKIILKQNFIDKIYEDFKNNIINFDQLNILLNTQKETTVLIKEEKQDPIVIGNDTLKGRKIQLINPDNLNVIVKVYSSMIHVLKDNNTYDKQAIHNAIKNNTIYKSFRWLFVEHTQDCNVVNDIKETIVSNQPKTHIIVQLNKDKNQIINSFNSIKKMKQDFKIGDRKLHKTIDESLLYNNTYFMKLKDCSQALIDKYLANGNELASRTSSKSKPIKKINDITKEETIYKSITEAALQSGTSDKSITDSIKNKKLLKGFNWEYI